MAKKEKKRADHLVVEQGLFTSGAKAQAAIMAGEIFAGDVRINKAGEFLPTDTRLTFRSSRPQYASRGGSKLEGAIKEFGIDMNGWNVIDVGASTGGFVDCLLQHGVKHVVAADVGKNLLDDKLRNDERVTVLDGCNARYISADDLPDSMLFDLATVDVSFISLSKIIPPLAKLNFPRLLVLVKPQFEVGKNEVGKGGVVRNAKLHERVIDEVRQVLSNQGYEVRGPSTSPLKGPKGNVEFFLYGEKG